MIGWYRVGLHFGGGLGLRGGASIVFPFMRHRTQPQILNEQCHRCLYLCRAGPVWLEGVTGLSRQGKPNASTFLEHTVQ